MSLAEPLPIGALADLLLVEDLDFDIQWNQERSLTGGGRTLYADRAPGLRQARITSSWMTHAKAEELMAVINSRAGGLKTVLLYNSRLPYPASDPTGVLFGDATPAIDVITDPLHLSFLGFPADYVVPAGTYFGAISAAGSLYYLGQFAEAATAGEDGTISTVEVAPALPASFAHADPVTVAKPVGRFRITPNTAHPSKVASTLSRITFSAEQTY